MKSETTSLTTLIIKDGERGSTLKGHLTMIGLAENHVESICPRVSSKIIL